MPSINDNFADAIEVVIPTDGATFTSTVTTTGNTTEPGEPTVSASDNVSAWWGFTPATSGTATFDTQLSTPTGSGTDTYMAIWTGTNFGDMVNVAANDDGGGSATSLVSNLAVVGGTTYWVQVGGFGLQTMNMTLRVVGPATVPPPPPPVVTYATADRRFVSTLASPLALVNRSRPAVTALAENVLFGTVASSVTTVSAAVSLGSSSSLAVTAPATTKSAATALISGSTLIVAAPARTQPAAT